tara:strand:+ start:1348 stop:1710 length:363 start_codon:yes stop_codon:yes gene_type:complete
MYELLWFVGGALTYKVLAKLLRLIQLYLFFQEIHMHMLIMLEAISKDLESACEIKSFLLKDSEFPEDEVDKISGIDQLAILAWKENTVKKLQKFSPGPFKHVMQYNSWSELEKYLDEIRK